MLRIEIYVYFQNIVVVFCGGLLGGGVCLFWGFKIFDTHKVIWYALGSGIYLFIYSTHFGSRT